MKMLIAIWAVLMLCSAGRCCCGGCWVGELVIDADTVIEDGTDFVQDPRQSDNDPDKANNSDTPPYKDVDPVVMVSGDYVYQTSDILLRLTYFPMA